MHKTTQVPRIRAKTRTMLPGRLPRPYYCSWNHFPSWDAWTKCLILHKLTRLHKMSNTAKPLPGAMVLTPSVSSFSTEADFLWGAGSLHCRQAQWDENPQMTDSPAFHHRMEEPNGHCRAVFKAKASPWVSRNIPSSLEPLKTSLPVHPPPGLPAHSLGRVQFL